MNPSLPTYFMKPSTINSPVREFLEQSVDAFTRLGAFKGGINGYPSLYHFVLAHGRPFGSAIKKPKDIPWGGRGNCFCNAATLAMDRDGLIYCEGYAAGVIPVHHAWCVNRHGSVIDNTWRKGGNDYFGIPISNEYLVKSLLKYQTYGLIDRWDKGFPMLHDDPEQWKI